MDVPSGWKWNVVIIDDIDVNIASNGDNRKLEAYDDGLLIFEASACPITEEELICFYQKLK